MNNLIKNQLKIKQKVNCAVSFHAIKSQAMALLFSGEKSDIVIGRLEKLFLMNPVLIRKNRKVPRKKRSTRHQVNCLKRKRKIIF
ncbi:hypothetical protein QUF74_07095 [Candidatus Halobeggiatoa sp. HSG11]|nr:hypothetical protein [Candidatus Halobeggiatoa sp. HSG11]